MGGFWWCNSWGSGGQMVLDLTRLKSNPTELREDARESGSRPSSVSAAARCGPVLPPPGQFARAWHSVPHRLR